MKEKRIDKMTKDIVIYAKDRMNRPIDKFNKNTNEDIEISEYDEECPFCRGNEKLTPNHTYEVKNDEGWIVKSTLNKFPIIDDASDYIYGTHEVMIESCKHNKNFYNMEQHEVEEVLRMYKNRYSEFIKDEKIEYVSLFKNYLNKAGASLLHPHAQIISLPFIPPDIQREINIAKEYYNKNNSCIYMDTIKEEIEYKERIVYNGDKILAIIPYATRHSGEIRVFFKEKIRFEDIDDKHIEEISEFLLKLFKNIEVERGNAPFNLYIHNYPKNIDSLDYYQVHIHIIPRIFNLGGFELSTGVYATSLVSEEYAKKLRVE